MAAKDNKAPTEDTKPAAPSPELKPEPGTKHTMHNGVIRESY